MKITKELALAFRKELENVSSVIIGTHLNPDGDALGSALAVSLFLDGLGIPNEVLCHHNAPANLKFLPNVAGVRQKPKQDKHDLGIVVDLDALDRLGQTEPYFHECKRMVVVDHHLPHESPGDLRIVDSSEPATSLILSRLLLELGANITPDIATCLLTGIVTDTGSFRFRNTTPDALSISAILLEHGGDINLISEEVFQSKPLSSVRLLGHALETMRLDCDRRLAWSSLSNHDFVVADALDEDTEGVVNEMLFITSVQIAALIREPEPGKIRCSFRSRSKYDVAVAARDFGGGGHKNAAGCTFDLPLKEAEELVVRRLKLCLESC
ncbi:MAG: bifunctional oligoribonuclease/PAP phosphatase NrnA [Fimbriimonas sp.]|nr:bifunctional oligoribonuclease/PAP phosphatase NrnA [Fimbriimonas sp.]